jgi:hypothetical protein
VENNIEMIENILNTERRNRRGNREIRFEVNSNCYKAVSKLLSDYKRVLKENEELKISNKEIDKECSRLEKKEVELINENEHYEDLIYALKTYYDITEEDLEKCMKNDR